MFAVVVQFEIVPTEMDAFLPLMHANARASLQEEPGCQRFDVLTDETRPTSVVLYELYDDAAAFDTHLASAHFASFDAASSPMIAKKTVSTWATVVS